MKQFAILALCLLPFTALQAQTTKEEMLANPLRMGGNNMAYNPEIKPQTPAPKGYKPFYISHYGRHGSRYHYTHFDYMMLYNQMKSADEANALTPRGKELKKRIDALYEDGRERAGDLTQKGFDQHQGIAERMVKSFPEVFGPNALLDVKSSTSHRVIMSMDAFLQKVNSMRPGIKVKTESSRRIMKYINNEERDSVTAKLKNDAYKEANAKIHDLCTHPDRIINEIFSDQNYVKEKVRAEQFVSKLFEINCNMQDISDLNFDFSSIGTPTSATALTPTTVAQNAVATFSKTSSTKPTKPSQATALQRHSVSDTTRVLCRSQASCSWKAQPVPQATSHNFINTYATTKSCRWPATCK